MLKRLLKNLPVVCSLMTGAGLGSIGCGGTGDDPLLEDLAAAGASAQEAEGTAAAAEAPVRVVDVSGRLQTRMEPFKLEQLRQALIDDGRERDAARLEQAYDFETGNLRNPSLYGLRPTQDNGEITVETRAASLTEDSLRYRVHHVKPPCKWVWQTFFWVRQCPNPAFSWMSPWVNAGESMAGNYQSNYPIDDIEIAQDPSWTTPLADRPPEFYIWTTKEDGSEGFGYAINGSVTLDVADDGKKITSITMFRFPRNPWVGIFYVSTVGNETVFPAQSITDNPRTISDSRGFDAFGLDFYGVF